MGEKVKYLTDIIADGTIESEIRCGVIAVDNEMYEQAWSHFYKVYKSNEANTDQKGEASYLIYDMMKKISIDHPFLEKLIEIDPGLRKMSSTKTLTNEYVRKYIGRKYLKNSAECDYDDGLVEYGLSCVDCGESGSFRYECNDANLEAGLAWGKKMYIYDSDKVRHAANIIIAKYYFVKCINSNLSSYIEKYGDSALNAQDIYPDDQYTNYFMGHLHLNPKFKSYYNGLYYDPKKGYECFKKVVSIGKDPALVESAKSVLNMVENKFSSIIK